MELGASICEKKQMRTNKQYVVEKNEHQRQKFIQDKVVFKTGKSRQ